MGRDQSYREEGSMNNNGALLGLFCDEACKMEDFLKMHAIGLSEV